MPKTVNFNDLWLRSITLRTTGQATIWDEITEGLGVKVGTKSLSFVVRFNIAGRRREMTIGTWPELRLSAARKKAREIRAQAIGGADALAQREKREAELSRDATFGAMIRRYWATDAKHKKLRQRGNEEKLIENHVLPRWQDRPVSDLTSADALDLLEAIAVKTPIMANRVLFALRRPFRWAINRRLILASPVADIERLTPENARTRTLKDAEIRAIWTAAGDMGVFGLFVRALFVTGSRRDEVRGAAWAEFDLDGATWTRPEDRMKGRIIHVLPVTPMLRDILDRLETSEGYVFSTDGGVTRYAALSRAKIKLDSLSKVTDWTLHDIRRTVRTRLAEIGVPFEIAEKILAHRTDKMEAVYNHHQYVNEKRDALLRCRAVQFSLYHPV